MLFTEPRFLLFFLLAFGVHWTMRPNRARKLWLLLCSYVFYAAWDWRFLSLILASTLVDYIAGRMMAREKPPIGRRWWLIASLITNLGILSFFKYFNFFVESGTELLQWLGLAVGSSTLEIVLPVGISFFTFQTMSYTIDVYARRLEAVRDPWDFALFVAFFPQLVAGPIVRAIDFLPQLTVSRSLSQIKFRWAFGLFLAGFIKKVCVADQLAVVVDQVFQDPSAFDAVSVWIAVVGYAVQIYCDFSGYSDMAIACAALLGFELRRNFHFPYLAINITDFWRRWHMSLSSWLRDYLYITLGGNRGSRLFTHRNLLLTMLLGGLWHGAGWRFVIWGGIHGLALVLHKEWLRKFGESRLFKVPLLARMATIYVVLLAWIFFRATSLADAGIMTRAFVLFQGAGETRVDTVWGWLLLPLLAVHVLSATNLFQRNLKRYPQPVLAITYGVVTAIMMLFVPLSNRPFIYFQF